MRKTFELKTDNPETCKALLLNAYDKQECLCLLNSNGYKHDRYASYDFVLATLPVKQLKISCNQNNSYAAFEQLKEFYDQQRDWIFGYFSYDLKNILEKLKSKNSDYIKAPELHFFQPGVVFFIKDKSILVSYLPDSISVDEIKEIFSQQSDNQHLSEKGKKPPIVFSPKISKDKYLSTLSKILLHIQLGDIYEMNFCQEFYAENASINPQQTYWDLVQVSPTPFSCYYKTDAVYLICASPERFLQKKGNRIISQPIKGTIKRGKTSKEDEKFRNQLQNSEKDKSENVMIVDLVRNDLSKIAEKASVCVDELFGIYAFEQVFQMISTVSCKLKPDAHILDVIKNAFPMGSMTGAPNIRAMELIEKYESTKRGVYSGSVGYISPEGNFDFNVVIRSLVYNSENKYLSYMVGGAITIDSDPEKEYEECLLKAEAITKAMK